jgi:hypothetical protein
MIVQIFLSTVSDEFRLYRDQLRNELKRPNVAVEVQESIKDFGHGTLRNLDIYIESCDAVIHLVGDMTGSCPAECEVVALRKTYPDLTERLPPLAMAIKNGENVTYTQWEAWLALYHNKALLIAKADEDVTERGPRYSKSDASREAQRETSRQTQGDGSPSGLRFQKSQLARQIRVLRPHPGLVGDRAAGKFHSTGHRSHRALRAGGADRP